MSQFEEQTAHQDKTSRQQHKLAENIQLRNRVVTAVLAVERLGGVILMRPDRKCQHLELYSQLHCAAGNVESIASAGKPSDEEEEAPATTRGETES